MQTTTCPRCSGNGRIVGFSHIVGGRCFECGGAGKVDLRSLPVSAVPAAKPLPYRTFTFQGREGTVMEVRGITQIKWNGGQINMRGSEIINFTQGIPRKIHAAILAVAI